MNDPAAQLAATVVITTRNRKDDLRTALRSAVEQDAKPAILVIDDGSTDGTSDMVHSEFPQVRLDRSENSRGLIVQRNRAAGLATTPIIVSIDDDAVFTTPGIVSSALAAFDHPRVGAVAIPFINVRQDAKKIHQLGAGEGSVTVGESYAGTAHALRRELFLRLDGYREQLFHQCEEEDYCIRMLGAGYVVRLCRADPIHHFESPRRDVRRIDVYGRRNNVLFGWCNVPMPYLPLHLLGTTFNAIRQGWQFGRLGPAARGAAAGYVEIVRGHFQRRPVKKDVYRLFRELRRGGPLELSQIETRLPPVA